MRTIVTDTKVQGPIYKITNVPNYLALPSRAAYEKANLNRDNRQSMWNAEGGVVPIIYGTQRVGGKVIFADQLGTSNLYLLCLFCTGEVDEIEEIYINDRNVTDLTGITVEKYTGTADQNICTSLKSPFDSYYTPTQTFEDAYPNICYAYIKVSSSASLTGFPRVIAQIRGKKVYDPRDANQSFSDSKTWEYSNNPALCLADLITSNRYGLNKSIDWDTVALCANHNDKILVELGEPTASTSPYPFCPIIDPLSKTLINTWTPQDLCDSAGSYIKEFIDDYKDDAVPDEDYSIGEACAAVFYDWLYYKWIELGGPICGTWPLASDSGTPGGDQSLYYAEVVPDDFLNFGYHLAKIIKDAGLYSSVEYGDFETQPTATLKIEQAQNFLNQWQYFNVYRIIKDGSFFDPNTGAVHIISGEFGNRSFTKYWPISGRPLNSAQELETTQVARTLDIVIDTEQETSQWIEILRGYANCFVVTTSSTYKLVPDKPVGYGYYSEPSASAILTNAVTNTNFSEFTIEVSVRPDISSTGTQTILNKTEFLFYYDKDAGELNLVLTHDTSAGGNTFVFYTYTGSLTIPTHLTRVDGIKTITYGNATTIGVTVNAYAVGKMYYFDEDNTYVDIPLTTYPTPLDDTAPLYVPNSANDFEIGMSNAVAGSFSGLIDELRVWNRYRTEEETIATFDKPIPQGSDSSLICHIPFNEGIDSRTKASAATTWTTASYAVDLVSNTNVTMAAATTTSSVWTQYDGRYDFYKFDKNNIIENSFRLKRRGSRDIPTIIELAYTDIDTGDEPYREEYAVADASMLNNGLHRVSRVAMPGITRYSQAFREGVKRYNNNICNIIINFQAFDDSLNIDISDPIQLHHPVIESPGTSIFKPFRVSGIQQLNDTGLWSISAVEYDPGLYGDEFIGIKLYDISNLESEKIWGMGWLFDPDIWGLGWSTTILTSGTWDWYATSSGVVGSNVWGTSFYLIPNAGYYNTPSLSNIIYSCQITGNSVKYTFWNTVDRKVVDVSGDYTYFRLEDLPTGDYSFQSTNVQPGTSPGIYVNYPISNYIVGIASKFNNISKPYEGYIPYLYRINPLPEADYAFDYTEITPNNPSIPSGWSTTYFPDNSGDHEKLCLMAAEIETSGTPVTSWSTYNILDISYVNTDYGILNTFFVAADIISAFTTQTISSFQTISGYGFSDDGTYLYIIGGESISAQRRLYRFTIVGGVATIESEDDYINLETSVYANNYWCRIISNQTDNVLYLLAYGNNYNRVFKLTPNSTDFPSSTISTIYTSTTDIWRIGYGAPQFDGTYLWFYDLTEDKNSNYRYIVRINGSNDETTMYPIDREIYPIIDSYRDILIPTDTEIYYSGGYIINFGIKSQ